jgi:3-hydroxybutyryl-CoA dehydrogenase
VSHGDDDRRELPLRHLGVTGHWRILVVGAGAMGSEIGCELALGGHRVTFLVRGLASSRARVEDAFDTAREAGLANDARAAASLRSVAFVTNSSQADAPDLVLESIPEHLETKRDVLEPLARRWPHAIVASNTSSIPLTLIGEAIGAPERTLGMHYWNPPLLMPPVEVVAGERTDATVVARVRELLAALGKQPVVVERDVPGFVWNRLQAALLREALWLVEHGVAEPRVVDEVVRSGLARRSRFTGPFETVALGGLESWQRMAENVFPSLSNAGRPAPLERWLDRAPDELEAIRRRRDEGLVEELRRP